jgi:hypothetical protein
MEQADVANVAQLISDEVAKRFPGAPVQDVAVLQYGDEPIVEPGEVMVRVTLASADEEDEREKTLQKFERAHRKAIHQFRQDLSKRLPDARRLEFRTAGEHRGPTIVLAGPGRHLQGRAAAGGGGGDLTPVMARLGPADLETLDTLITAGIAPNRAEAVRWALARIRERPAYEQIVARTREIEELKAQF